MALSRRVRHVASACAAALTLSGLTATAMIAPPALAADATPVTITPNPWYASEPFDGWGTSLVWFANATGSYPEELREPFYQAVFGEDGLALNIARYNIGGEDASDVVDYLRKGGAIDGWWAEDPDGALGLYGGTPTTQANRAAILAAWDPEDPTHYDFNADQTQRWWLQRLVEDGTATKIEAFVNSSPWFMTNNGWVYGNGNSTNGNLNSDPAALAKYVGYLDTVVKYLENTYDFQFTTLEPFNEPSLSWGATNGPNRTDSCRAVGVNTCQEGQKVTPAVQASALAALANRLALDPSDPTLISSPDDTSPDVMTSTWNSWPAAAKAIVDQLNTHTYGQNQRLRARDISKAADKPLYMSEIEGNWAGSWNPLSMGNGLGIAQRMIDDVRELESNAWVLWQPVEDFYNMEQPGPRGENLNWGGVFIDFDCQPYPDGEGGTIYKSARRVADAGGDHTLVGQCEIAYNTKLGAIRNFTKFIAPGDYIIPSTQSGTTMSALSGSGSELTMVHTNSSATDQALTVDLSKFGRIAPGATATVYTTTAPDADASYTSLADMTKNSLVPQEPVRVDLASASVTVTIPAQSVTSVVVNGVSGVAPEAAALTDGDDVFISSTQTGRYLTAGVSAATSTAFPTTSAEAAAQRWTAFEAPAANQTAAKRFVLQADDGRFLTAGTTGSATALTTYADLDAAKAEKAAQWILNTVNGETYQFLSANRVYVLQTSTANANVTLALSPTGAATAAQLWGASAAPTQVSAAPVELQTPQGIAPTLPTTVIVAYNTGTTQAVPVTWDMPATNVWRLPGEVVVTGTTDLDPFGSQLDVTATVVVGEFSTVDPAYLAVLAGSTVDAAVGASGIPGPIADLLPGTVSVHIGDSPATFTTPVTWDLS
ncbi:MAG: Ig-like domain-containing protein, partial [Bifidobacteriaceae bacterium]|nr:Ig-like domain-containing protein [Bifidobacteriaceae bacterium]